MINATIHQPQMALRIVFETFAFNKPKEDIWRLEKKSERIEKVFLIKFSPKETVTNGMWRPWVIQGEQPQKNILFPTDFPPFLAVQDSSISDIVGRSEPTNNQSLQSLQSLQWL